MPAPTFWLDPDEDDFPAPPDVPWRPDQRAKPIPSRRRITAPGRVGFLAIWAAIILFCAAVWIGFVAILGALMLEF